ncbi:MAG: hypothetical protein WDM80_08495, partial [Limisphaerales bacterium]
MRRNFSIFLLASFLAGCATKELPPTVNLPPSPKLFPADALITQRGVLTVRGRQFTLNGYIAKSATGGLRLIMTENFGGVLADVLVKPDGRVFVLQAKPPFREAWVERFIAADLKCVLAAGMETDCPVRMLSPTHFVITRRQYELDLRTVEVKPGFQPTEMFAPARGGKP